MQIMGASVQHVIIESYARHGFLRRCVVIDFSATVLPNIAFWNVSNGTWEYQIQLAWPLNWSTPLENVTVETM